jgi:hypothetical protein
MKHEEDRMNAEINPGDRVVYYPQQNSDENLHFDAIVLARAKRHNFFMIDVIGGRKVRVHRKRLIAGQIDAFQDQSVG